MTISVLAAAPRAGLLGVASASQPPAVGANVPALAPGLGAVVTQAWTNPHLRGHVLGGLAQGGPGTLRVGELVERVDPGSALRQVAVVAADGAAQAWTGESCTEWAGHRTGPGWAVAGNYLAGAAVVDSAATVLRDGVEALAGGTDAADLADLLLAALEAAQAEGGDRRGERSAVVLVGATAEQEVAGSAGCPPYPPYLALDLRCDDDPQPLAQLRRLLALSPRTE